MNKLIQDGWRKTNLGECFDVLGGDSAPQDESLFSKRDGIPFVRMKTLGKVHQSRNLCFFEEYISPKTAAELGMRLFKKGVIILPRSGSVYMNHRAILGEDVYLVGHLAALIKKPNILDVDNEFVYYYLCNLNLVPWSTRTTGLDSISFKELKGVPLWLPPFSEQRKIAEILSSVDAVIEKTRAVIDQTQILKKGLMQELFTRGIPGRHKKFKKTEIGEIPEEWEVMRAGELISLCQYGLNNRLSSEPIGIPILRMNNLVNSKINTSDVKYAILSHEEERKYLLEFGDLLFNRTNSRDLVGKVAIYKGNQKMSFASYLLRLRVNPDKADPKWLNYYFNTDEVMTKLRHLATPGVSQSNINSKAMQSLKLANPSLEEQREMADSIDLIDERISREIQIKEKLGFLKFALMQSLLTGEIRVKV